MPLIGNLNFNIDFDDIEKSKNILTFKLFYMYYFILFINYTDK